MLLEFNTRAELVAAVTELLARGVHAEVVGLGRTLRVCSVRAGLADAIDDDDLIGSVSESVEQWDDDRVRDFLDTCTDEELQVALDNRWVTEDQVLAAMEEPKLDPDIQAYVDGSTEGQLRQAVADGHIDKETLGRYEAAGKARKGVLAFASEAD